MLVTGINSNYKKSPSFSSSSMSMNVNNEQSVQETFAKAKMKKDIYKDTPVRMLGFTNELGAAAAELCFSSRGIIKHVPTLSYIPAVVYIGADSYDKYKRGIDGNYETPSVKTGTRELLSQVVTSVLAPTAVVLGVQKGVKKLIEVTPEAVKKKGRSALEFLKKNKVTKTIFKNNETVKKAVIVGASLTALVLATKPIDKISEKLFEKTVDPILKLNKKD